MKIINEPLVEELQKIAYREAEQEIKVYDPLVKGQIIMRGGRIKNATCGNTRGRNAVEKLIMSGDVKYTLHDLHGEVTEYAEDVDFEPAEIIIPMLVSSESGYSEKSQMEETQILTTEDRNEPVVDLKRYDISLLQCDPSGKICKEHYLQEGRNLAGRLDGCHVQLKSALVSRIHAMILVTQNAIYIQDLQTANGTILNGRAISGKVKIHDGDTLELGDTRFELSLKLKIRRNGDPGFTTWKGVENNRCKTTRVIHFKKYEEKPKLTTKVNDVFKEIFNDSQEKSPLIGIVNED